MLLLTTTTDVIQIVTGSAITLDVHASWVDNASGTITPGRTNTEITTATTTTVVGSPAASTQRNVQTMLVTNLSASAGQVTINYFDGTAVVSLFSLSLLAGYTVQFAAGSGFTVFTSAGVILSAGATGATGATGPTGPQGPQLVSVMQGDQGDEGAPEWGTPTVGTNMGPTRAQLAPSAKNWTFLGRSQLAATATTVGPIIWTGSYANLYFEYIITGYQGAAIGRLLCGAGTPSTTALTNAVRVIEFTSATLGPGIAITGSVFGSGATNQPGLPLSALATATNVARTGIGWLWGDSGSLKSVKIEGTNATTATVALGATPSTIMASAYFSDLGTNLPIQQMQLTSYTAVSGTTIGSAFNIGTYLTVWGRNND